MKKSEWVDAVGSWMDERNDPEDAAADLAAMAGVEFDPEPEKPTLKMAKWEVGILWEIAMERLDYIRSWSSMASDITSAVTDVASQAYELGYDVGVLHGGPRIIQWDDRHIVAGLPVHSIIKTDRGLALQRYLGGWHAAGSPEQYKFDHHLDNSPIYYPVTVLHEPGRKTDGA